MFDHPDSFLALCDQDGVCPGCGELLADCRCGEDAELEAEFTTSHPVECLCHADLDAERNDAPARERAYKWRPRPLPLHATGAFIGSGCL